MSKFNGRLLDPQGNTIQRDVLTAKEFEMIAEMP